MEIYLPVIKATLAEWLQLTIDHPLYAAALIIGVWLLTALLYSIKIAGLNKKNLLSEQARTTVETTLNTAQQQLQQVQDEVTAITEQLEQQQQLTETEKQRVVTTEQQLAQRNHDIASTIQSLASSFDIGERPLTAPQDLKADELWQQHDKTIKKLIERLHTEQQAKTELEKFYQAEKIKLAETEAKLDSLQINLDSQTSLVLALQTQTTTLQQQQNDTQRDLTEVLKKHQADLARLLQLEQQAVLVTHAQTQETTPVTPIAPPVHAEIVEQAVLTPSVEEANQAVSKMQDLFKKPQQPPTPVPAIPEIETIILEQAITDILVNNEQPEIAPVEEPEPLATVEAVAEIPEKTPKVSALKGMYQKFTTSKTEQAEPIPTSSIADAEIKVDTIQETDEEPKSSALKGFYQKFTSNKAEPEAAPAVPATEPASTSTIKTEIVEETPEKTSNIQQLKGLYKKYTTPKVQEKDLAPESFDDSSSSLEDAADRITEKLEQLKGLYGKFFSKDKE